MYDMIFDYIRLQLVLELPGRGLEGLTPSS